MLRSLEFGYSSAEGWRQNEWHSGKSEELGHRLKTLPTVDCADKWPTPSFRRFQMKQTQPLTLKLQDL